ncbi:phospholipid-transporting ATPase ABCA3-like [Physella acuta]|uniref:phospholipid-transporting ATPase ABCA3-like n=1 Tax=Physella acuta TaxID=109671 RepID=UPI0027DBDF26|nr:phospholipid-transporting ATPase ABCA3-like [Physella acuta]
MRKASYPRPIHEDVDVKAEREKIKTTDIATLKKKNAILLVDAQKNYARQCSSRCAVHSLSLSIGHNECFGILGQTGSGKTTIFKMLTGEISITQGDIFVHGDSVKTTRTQKTIGYCPQLPALQHRLTGREVLLLYARLKGVVGDSVSQLVEDIIDFIKLRPHEDKQTKNYSNGTKRKLSVGIAIVCNPNLLVLDDPTAGMDPVSRRNMWDIMLSIKAHKRTILMTSHSIEECQALCGKFAIIKKGQLLCLGSRESLENKFKTVYSVFLYANQLENGLLIPIEPAVDFVHGSFINVVLFSKQKALCQLQIPQHVRLSALFTILEKAKESYNLKHYTVQKTSLEQIFFKMIKEEHY